MRLATFDIFDTTLVRKCGAPGVVFDLMAVKLWTDDGMRRTEFLNVRRQAAARNTLADIYAHEGMAMFPDYSAEELMAAELVVEAGQLTVNPLIKQEIQSLRRQGWDVKFLSDMYLPSDFLASVLKREGCMEEGEEVIVSCEWNARKDAGSLYRMVRDKYHPSLWRHYGDNRRSDYRMARKNGVKAFLCDNDFTGVEKRIIEEGKTIRDGWRMSFLAGISRTARMKAECGGAAVLAADYVAALYIPYVIWLLRRAQSMGLKRLHFLSRDGYIMMKIAEILAPDDIELNYLFVSRKALMRAYIVEDSANRFVEIADRKSLIGRKVDYFLGQLQLSRNKIKEEYGIAFDYDRIVSRKQQDDFLVKIFGNEKFTPHMFSHLASDSALTNEYLRQEGLADSTAQAMVDIGWLGTSRLMVNKILGKNIPTFYVGVRGDVYDRSCGDFDSYFSAGQLDTIATGLIENYYSASPWPSTVGYRRNNDGGIEPCFGEGQKFEENAIVKANVDICQYIARNIKPYIDLFDDDMLFRWAKLSLDSIVAMKDKVDLSPLTNGGDFDGVAMARRLSTLELLNFAFAGARYTAFDRASLRLTLGSQLDRPVWKLHESTSKIRERLYRLIIKG